MKSAYIQYSPKVDVYAYGIMMWEALELKQPWSEENYKKYSHLIFSAVEEGKRPSISPGKMETAPRGYIELMKACWSQSPDARPPFDVVTSRLQKIQLAVLSSAQFKVPDVDSKMMEGGDGGDSQQGSEIEMGDMSSKTPESDGAPAMFKLPSYEHPGTPAQTDCNGTTTEVHPGQERSSSENSSGLDNV